jgi:hypothetical protein
VPTKRGTVSLTKVKSYNSLLRMRLVGIRSYLKTVLRYKFLILDSYHRDTLYMSTNARIRGYLSKPKKGCVSKKMWETLSLERLGNIKKCLSHDNRRARPDSNQFCTERERRASCCSMPTVWLHTRHSSSPFSFSCSD